MTVQLSGLMAVLAGTAILSLSSTSTTRAAGRRGWRCQLRAAPDTSNSTQPEEELVSIIESSSTN